MDNIVSLRVESEVHYNWLHTSTCSVWEFQASPRKDIPATFRNSFIVPLASLHLDVDFLRSILFVHRLDSVSQLLDYIYVLLILGPFMFGMPDITTIILSPTLDPSVDLGVVLGGTTTPYLAHRFGSVHIPSSIPFAEDFHPLCLVLTLVFTLTGVVVDMGTLGLHLTFLIMSHRPPHCFL